MYGQSLTILNSMSKPLLSLLIFLAATGCGTDSTPGHHVFRIVTLNRAELRRYKLTAAAELNDGVCRPVVGDSTLPRGGGVHYVGVFVPDTLKPIRRVVVGRDSTGAVVVYGDRRVVDGKITEIGIDYRRNAGYIDEPLGRARAAATDMRDAPSLGNPAEAADTVIRKCSSPGISSATRER